MMISIELRSIVPGERRGACADNVREIGYSVVLCPIAKGDDRDGRRRGCYELCNDRFEGYIIGMMTMLLMYERQLSDKPLFNVRDWVHFFLSFMSRSRGAICHDLEAARSDTRNLLRNQTCNRNIYRELQTLPLSISPPFDHDFLIE